MTSGQPVPRVGGSSRAFTTTRWTLVVESGCAVLATHLGSSEGAVKVAVHRLRARLREGLQQEVASTVVRAEDPDDELRHLLAALNA
jgi:sirohydrochlorin ferrochelatase